MSIPSRKLTRRELPEFFAQHGYPISIHMLNRLCGPSTAAGPPSVGRWGVRDLYDAAECLAWAETRAGVRQSNAQSGIARVLEELATAEKESDTLAILACATDLIAKLPEQAGERATEKIVDLVRELALQEISQP